MGNKIYALVLATFLVFIIGLTSDNSVHAATGAVEGGTCSPARSYSCLPDGDTQLYCYTCAAADTNHVYCKDLPAGSTIWQFSQKCSVSNRKCENGQCNVKCGDGICGIYEKYSNCAGISPVDCKPTAEAGYCSNNFDDDQDGKTDCADSDCSSDSKCVPTPSPTIAQEPTSSPSPSPATCGNNVCENGETITNCYSDCSTSASACTYFTCLDGKNVPCKFENNKCTCDSCPVPPTPVICSKDQPWNCVTETDCKSAGNNWCDGKKCINQPCPTYTCNQKEPWNCRSETDCKNIGSYWCGSSGCQSSSCPVCSKDQSWVCTETECKGVGGYWCDGKCINQQCPTCSREQPFACRAESDCKNAGAYWCLPQNGGTGWCQQGSCPTYTCNQKEPWNCKSEIDCTKNNLKWCKYPWGDAKCDFSCPEAAKPTCLAVLPPYTQCKPGEESVSTFDNNGCPTGNYCKAKDICTTEWRPVCGNDGKTYSNMCRANSAGVPVKYEGECGTKTICDDRIVEERTKKCQLENGKPVQYTGPNGCTDIFCKYATMKPPIAQPPTDCVEEKDPVTGFVSYTCAVKAAIPACPRMREEDRRYAKDKCYAYGGTPDYRKSAEGCEYLDCNFEKTKAFEAIECLAETQIKEIENKCNSLGLKTVYKAMAVREKEGIPEKDCKSARCIDYIRTEGCPTTLPPESKIVCPMGAMETVGIDERGCNIMKCVTKEEKECPLPPPKEAFLKCEGQGGKMIVKQDERGCARFVECVSGSEEDIYVEKVSKIPETMEVLQFALKLEEMKISLDVFSKKIDKIAEYYKTKSSADYEKYKRVKALLSTASETLDKVKGEMRRKIDTLRTDDIEIFKYRVREIKQIFKKILYVLLGGEEAKEELKESVDCGTSSECMENAFKMCRPAKISQSGSSSGGGGPISEIAVVGLDGDKCVLKWTAGAETMTCRFENYALGTQGIGGPENMEKYCEGSLVIKLARMTTATKIAPREAILNSVVNAVKLSQDPNDLRYVFTASDPDSVSEFSITKSNFDGISIFRANNPGECVKEAKSDEVKLSPKDFPLTVSVDDCGESTIFRHEMKMDISLKTETVKPSHEASSEPIEQVGQAQKPGPVVNGVKVSSDPNDLRYRFAAHDADGIREFYIEKKNFDNVYVKIDPPCSKSVTEVLEFNPSELPNPARVTVMNCGSPPARRMLNVNIESPEQPKAVVMPILQPVQQVLVATPTQIQPAATV